MQRARQKVTTNEIPDTMKQVVNQKFLREAGTVHLYSYEASRKPGLHMVPTVDITIDSNEMKNDRQFIRMVYFGMKKIGSYMGNFQMIDTAAFTTVNGIRAVYTKCSGEVLLTNKASVFMRMRIYVIPCNKYYFTIQLTDSDLYDTQKEFQNVLQTLKVTCP